MTSVQESFPPFEEDEKVFLRPDPSEGRAERAPAIVVRLKGDRVLVRVFAWGMPAGKRWVRLSELEKATWE